MEIQKIQMVVHIFSGFALFTQLMWLYRRVESLFKLLTANNVPFDLPTNECKSKYCPVHLTINFVMFDLRDTAVFMYKAAIHRYIFLFGEVNVMKILTKNFVQ